ncbi:MFS transporter [Actinokineospora sp. UTMC 2448]|uniref:MFS transporter n=1 Tax=Actinokineospora sp. UTMC 2448 TaxID=2268449 RepID=UPI0021649E2D|nr:MFS transporter [Actinokineospora sp. UTMC 2448]
MRGTRDLALVASGAAVSLFGTAVTLIVLLLHVKDFGSYAVVGVLIAEFVPVSLAAPLAGLLVDRLPNRRLMIAGQLLQAGAVIVVTTVLHSLPLILVTLVVLGCGTAVVNPAAAALIPAICGEDRSARGYSWLAFGRGTGMLAGSAAGGLLVAALGTRDALLVDAGTYLAQAALLSFVRTERDPRGRERQTGRDAATAGLRLLAADPVLRVATVCLAVACVGVMFADVATVFYVTGVLGGGAATLGLLHACWMLGVLTGARVAVRLTSQRALLLGLGTACAVMGVGMLIPAALPFTALAALGYIVGGAANGVQSVTNQGIVRARSPEHLRGRAFAAAGAVLVGANVLGTVLGGAVVALMGPRQTFVLAGIATLAAGVAALLALRAVDTTKTAPVT